MEIIILVALRAGRFRMFAVQRKFGLVVIEVTGGEDRFPPRSRMACLAGASEGCILKSAMVRIGVAILAIGKSQALVMRSGFTGRGPMTLRAGYILMKSSERIGSAQMIKTRGRFPGVLIVAAQAFRT